MYILDTDILSLIHAGDERVGRRKEHVPSEEISTTVVSKIEILRARFDFVLKVSDGEQLLRAQDWLFRSVKQLDQIPIVNFDKEAATEFDRLREAKGIKKIGRADLLIACIALANRATLVTRNLKHFTLVPNLTLENWAD